MQEALRSEGEGHLTISISYDGERKTLEIRDNANGMDISELTRAVVLDRKPPITTGRSEFGMGLKTAACWFGRRWSIETKKLGLKEKYYVEVNVRDLVENRIEEIPITVAPASSSEHYTILRIEELYKPIRTSTHSRIRDQLSSTYRQDLRSGEISILWNGVELRFHDPPMLVEEQENGGPVTWRKDIRISVPWETGKCTLMANGWVGIRSKGRQKDAGFVLMRRGRVIVGGPDSGYKPVEIFGQPNSFRSQRLVGEINMDDWPVTQAKDMFDWSGGLEEDFINALRAECRDYMNKAEDYRSLKKPPTDMEMRAAAEPAAKVFGSQEFGEAVSKELRSAQPAEPPETKAATETPTKAFIAQKADERASMAQTIKPSETKVAVETSTKAFVTQKVDEAASTAQTKKLPEQEESDLQKIKSVSRGSISFVMPIMSREWIFRLHWQDLMSESRWMSVEFQDDTQTEIYLNSAHPFFLPYMDNRSMLELIQKFVISLALAEKLARQKSPNNMIDPADLRNYMNKVLRYASQIKEESKVILDDNGG